MNSHLPSPLKLFLPAVDGGKFFLTLLLASLVGSQFATAAKPAKPNGRLLTKSAAPPTVPTLSYSSPQTYPLSTAITPLTPSSTGVDAPAYSSTATTFTTGIASPYGVATDAAGNLYVSDLGNAIVKEFPANNGSPIIIGSGQFKNPKGIAIDATGNVFAADGYYATVREVLKSDGSGASLGTGFNELSGVAVDAAGNVYVADFGNNNPVKKILKSDGSTTFVGTGFSNYVLAVATDAAGNVYVDDWGGGNIDKILASNGSTVTLVSGITHPQGVAVDAMGNVFFSDGGAGAIKELIGGSGSPVTLVSGLTNPGQLAVDAAGNVFFVDTTNNTVLEIKPVGGYYINAPLPAGLSFNGNTGVISGTTTALPSGPTNYTVTAYNAGGFTTATVNITVGNPPAPTLSYNGPNTYTSGLAISPLTPLSSGVALPAYSSTSVTYGSGYNSDQGLATDAAGNVYVCDFFHNTIVKIPAGGGSPTNFIQNLNGPAAVAIDAAGNFYVAESTANDVLKIPGGTGTPKAIGTGFNSPTGVAVDAAGNVYVADYLNNALKKILATDGSTISLGSTFSYPSGVAVDAYNNVYVAATYAGSVQEIPASGGPIVTLATGFNAPRGIAVDATGNVFVADNGNGAVKEISGGTIVSIGSSFVTPFGVAVDGAGNVYVADPGANKAFKVQPIGGYFINKVLPAGLSFSNASGVVSGTPSVASAAAIYTVSAYNIAGSVQATTNISVIAPTTIVSAVRSYTQNPTNGYYLSFTVTFADPVTGLIPSNFSVTSTGTITGAAINSVTGSGKVWTVGIVSGSGDGTVTLNMVNSLGVAPGISTTLPFVGDSYTIDKTPPTATELNYYSSNANIQKAVVGDVIHLEIGATEAVQPPVVTIAGHTVTAVSTGGNFYAATYTMKSTDAAGRIPFTVDFTDLAGNTSPHYTDSGAGDDIEFSNPPPVTGAPPTIQATKVLFSNITTTGTSVSWTKGNGSARAVFIFKGTNGGAIPANATTYTANTSYGSGTQIGSTGWYCIYNGAGTSVNVSGLIAGTVYRVTAVEYNGTAGGENYLTTGLSPASVQTLKIYPTVPALKVLFSNITTSSTTVSWTNGDGTARAVFIAQQANGGAIPVDNTAYTANTTFGLGTQSTAGWYCIYNGTGSTVNVTGLVAGTTYRVTVVEYNTISGQQKYLTTGLSPASVTTIRIYPNVPALAVKFTNTTGSTTTASWTNGDGTARAVFIERNSSGHATPLDGTTYTANPIYAAGEQIGSSGWYCIYNGTASSVNISGLITGTTYRVTVVEYLGTPGSEKYLVTSLNPANVTTTGVQPLNSLYVSGSEERTPLVTALDGLKVEANNILSPNGDGINDIWLVKNIAFYPNNTVSVYDREGKVVFTKKGYANDWDGTYRGSVLNQGTYYYTVDLGNGSVVKGFITVINH